MDGSMGVSGSPDVLLDVVAGVGWVTLNRPSAINAINSAIRRELPLLLERLDLEPDVKIIVLRGAGERGFCVGADIKEASNGEPIQLSDQTARSAYIEVLDRAKKPTIASIHGFCLGGGLELALACDFRIVSPDASFALPEIDLGLIPGGGGTQRLSRLVGLGRALEMTMIAKRIDANEAYRIGLVTRVAQSREHLAAETTAFAAKLAAKPSRAVILAKQAVRASCSGDLDEGLRLEKELFTVLQSSEDHREATAAFREKRRPQFVGR